jgi:sec-independent protein translocase protein TatA
VVGDILQPTHLLFILVIALLVLGPKRLPEVGRALGRTMRDFRSAISGEETHEPTITETAATVPAHSPPPEPAAEAAGEPSPKPAEAPAGEQQAVPKENREPTPAR